MALRPQKTQSAAFEILTTDPSNHEAQYGRIDVQFSDRTHGDGDSHLPPDRRWTGELRISVVGGSPEQVKQLINDALDRAKLE